MTSESFTIAFIKKDDQFIPSHVSEIKTNDIYYLLTDKTPTKHMKATQDASLDANNKWVVTGELVAV